MRILLAALMTALLGGCVSIGIGSDDTPALVHYVLDDARAAPPQPPAATRKLALQNAGGDPLAASTSIVYSRHTGERALYQFAAWTERPNRRLTQLVQQRLEARGRVGVVSQLGQPLQSDYLLTLAVEEMFHDVGTTPGRARLALRAELIDRRSRTRLAMRQFSAAPTVTEASAAAAVVAFAVATADVLDQLAPWVETALDSAASK